MKYIFQQTYNFCVQCLLYNLMHRDIKKIIYIYIVYHSFPLWFQSHSMFFIVPFFQNFFSLSKWQKVKRTQKLQWAVEKLKRKLKTVGQKKTWANVLMNFSLHLELLFVGLLRNTVYLQKSGYSLKKPGRTCVFQGKAKKNLAHCLGIFLFHFLLLYNGYEKKIYLF